MFETGIERIKKIAGYKKEVVEQLENLLEGRVGVYVDYANVRPWATKLNWNIDLKRLKQFLLSFDNVKFIKFYNGILEGDKISEKLSKNALKLFGDNFKTKQVKIMRHSVDYSSIMPGSKSLLEQFVRKCLLLHYKSDTIKYLNSKFEEMNKKGVYFIEDRKCNFDVEIGRDMLLDFEKDKVDTFVLWSGDSDFVDPIKQLLCDDKKVILFATARRVSKELNVLQDDDLFIFDIQKIRNFICYKKEINLNF